MEDLEAESTINLKSKLEKIVTKKAREIFVEVDREKLTSKNKPSEKPLEGGGFVPSVSDSFAMYGSTLGPPKTTKKTSTSNVDRGGGNTETLTKGVRFVLDRENCFLMELCVIEKDGVILKQFEKEVRQNGDLNSSR